MRGVGAHRLTGGGGDGQRRGPAVTAGGRAGVTRYDATCPALSQQFRPADQGRQACCSQPSFSCHTGSERGARGPRRAHVPTQRRPTPWRYSAEFNSSEISIIPTVTGQSCGEKAEE